METRLCDITIAINLRYTAKQDTLPSKQMERYVTSQHLHTINDLVTRNNTDLRYGVTIYPFVASVFPALDERKVPSDKLQNIKFSKVLGLLG